MLHNVSAQLNGFTTKAKHILFFSPFIPVITESYCPTRVGGYSDFVDQYCSLSQIVLVLLCSDEADGIRQCSWH